MFSYFPYAAAFIDGVDEVTVDPRLVGSALVIAPFVFVVIGFVSRNTRGPRQILMAMGLLLVLGLAIGLISPVLGASAGFGVGTALTLRMADIPDQLKRRLIGVAFAVVYTTLLLFVAPPAGVLTGAIVPTLMVGFADEYGAWRLARDDKAGGLSPSR
jgi:hypothetical protein